MGGGAWAVGGDHRLHEVLGAGLVTSLSGEVADGVVQRRVVGEVAADRVSGTDQGGGVLSGEDEFCDLKVLEGRR